MVKPNPPDPEWQTVELSGRPSLRQRVASMLARQWLQPVWETLTIISNHGRGYSNIRPELNGEMHFLELWAKEMRGRSEPVTVVDVGANEGDFTQAILQRCADARIFCFEPNPVTFDRLRKRFESRDGIVVTNAALGEKSGSLPLYDQSGRTGTGRASAISEVFSDVYRQETKSVEVQLTTLDEFVASHGIGKIDLLKIDTEGYEYPVLCGATRCLESGMIEWIQLEFNIHNAIQGHTFYKFFKLLRGYDLYRMLPHALYPVTLRNAKAEYQSINEVFKYANFVACRRPS